MLGYSNAQSFTVRDIYTRHFVETLRELSFKYPLSDVMSVVILTVKTVKFSNIFLADRTGFLKEKFLNRYIKYNKPK